MGQATNSCLLIKRCFTHPSAEILEAKERGDYRCAKCNALLLTAYVLIDSEGVPVEL